MTHARAARGEKFYYSIIELYKETTFEFRRKLLSQSEISPSKIERELIRIINRSKGYGRGARVTFVHILYKAKRSSRAIIGRECQND